MVERHRVDRHRVDRHRAERHGAERYRRRSALAHLGLEAAAAASPDPGAGVVLAECRPRGLLLLRGKGGDADFRRSVSAVLGIEPVAEPLAAVRRRDVEMLRLGPDEWLVATPDRRAERIERELRDALEGQGAALSDVSHGHTVIALSGPDARSLLAKGCPLDLHPRVFTPGRCAQSRLARCQVLIHQVGEAPAFEIHVPRSFAQYAWTWLEDAGQEFGVRIAPME